MTDEDKQFLIDKIEQVLQHYTDFTGMGADGTLATRIANTIEHEFAFVSYQGQDKFRVKEL